MSLASKALSIVLSGSFGIQWGAHTRTHHSRHDERPRIVPPRPPITAVPQATLVPIGESTHAREAPPVRSSHSTSPAARSALVLVRTTAESRHSAGKLSRQNAIDDDGEPPGTKAPEGQAFRAAPVSPARTKHRTVLVLPMEYVQHISDDSDSDATSPTSVETTFSSLQSFTINGSDRSIDIAAESAGGAGTGVKHAAAATTATAAVESPRVVSGGNG